MKIKDIKPSGDRLTVKIITKSQFDDEDSEIYTGGNNVGPLEQDTIRGEIVSVGNSKTYSVGQTIGFEDQVGHFISTKKDEKHKIILDSDVIYSL